MQQLKQLFSRACELSERGKKCNVDLNELTAIRDEFWALEQRAEAAEVALSELEKQQPMAYRWESPVNGKICYDGIKPLGVISQPLYLRPAPAINLAELVPPKVGVDSAPALFGGLQAKSAWAFGVNSTIDAIMRNIEEAK